MIDPSSGFAIVPAVLDATEAAALAQTLSDGKLDRSRAGARHLMTHAAVANVAHDRRLLDIATAFLGAAPIPYRATLFDKSPHHNWLVVWHQDTALPLRERRDVPGWGPWSVKSGIVYAHAPAAALARVIALRLHLDDSRADDGPLRVLPGTHSQGLLSDGDVHRLVAKLTVTDCLAPAGGVVAMRPLILHASSKAESDRPRRVLHIEYADSLEIGAGLHLAVA
jgi:hypothetical protein